MQHPGGVLGPGAVRGRVDQADDGVHRGQCGLGVDIRGLSQRVHPHLEVLPLKPSDPATVDLVEAVQVVSLQGDQEGVGHRELNVRRHQHFEAVLRIGELQPLLRAGQQVLTHVEQEFSEHRVLAAEMAVDARPGDPGRCAKIVDGHSVEASLGEEFSGSLKDQVTPPERRLGPDADNHHPSVDSGVNDHYLFC